MFWQIIADLLICSSDNFIEVCMSATVTHLLRYPVKSMGGHALQRSALTAKGIPGDRAWTLKDEERGGIAAAGASVALVTGRARANLVSAHSGACCWRAPPTPPRAR